MDISIGEIIFWIVMVLAFGASIISSASDKKKKTRRGRLDFGSMEKDMDSMENMILERAGGLNVTGGNVRPAPRDEDPPEKPRAKDNPPEMSSPGAGSPVKLSPVGKNHRPRILDRIRERPALVSAMLFREILERPPSVGDRDRRRGF